MAKQKFFAMIMLRFRKDYNLRIIALTVSVLSFLCITTYSYPSKDSLRVPLKTSANEGNEKIQEANATIDGSQILSDSKQGLEPRSLFKYVSSINIITEERAGLGDIQTSLKIARSLKRRDTNLTVRIVVKSGWNAVSFLIPDFDAKKEEVFTDNGIILINGLEKEVSRSELPKADVNIYTGFVSQNETLEKYRIPFHRAPINIFLGEYDYGLVYNIGNREAKDEKGNDLI
ncbi:MAG: hypothetical protein KKD11_03135, partial [Candidatus Omnitrophica bacterium]|nr:hypothetical protein [Candidatus Omnitrophota bacterium]